MAEHGVEAWKRLSHIGTVCPYAGIVHGKTFQTFL
ncbi:hypothetical protein PCA31118_02654 [Pandoraea captiosa]|uniref:Uncharacterized protein n=1 Tax=Pandoraea captiosa TaxID=2508302 RepID=A0A5E5A3I3_9BURK|nr:hypothetical protein PCA31118_02654 [Pandoraea captiosa]